MLGIHHIVSTWDSKTRIYTCVCGFQSKENIKTHSLSDVNCIDCLKLTVKRQSNEIEEMKKLARQIAR